MVKAVEAQKDRFGVAPILKVLGVAWSPTTADSPDNATRRSGAEPMSSCWN